MSPELSPVDQAQVFTRTRSHFRWFAKNEMCAVQTEDQSLFCSSEQGGVSIRTYFKYAPDGRFSREDVLHQLSVKSKDSKAESVTILINGEYENESRPSDSLHITFDQFDVDKRPHEIEIVICAQDGHIVADYVDGSLNHFEFQRTDPGENAPAEEISLSKTPEEGEVDLEKLKHLGKMSLSIGNKNYLISAQQGRVTILIAQGNNLIEEVGIPAQIDSTMVFEDLFSTYLLENPLTAELLFDMYWKNVNSQMLGLRRERF